MRILIADDDEFFQKFYQAQLVKAGYDVQIAPDGEVALMLIRTELPDLLILDLIMPKKDGFEVLEIIKNDPSLQKLPVIVFSTLGQEHDVTNALNLGAKGFVNKSFFDLNTLLSNIKTVVSAT